MDYWDDIVFQIERKINPKKLYLKMISNQYAKNFQFSALFFKLPIQLK